MEVKTKWDENQEYFSRNWKQLYKKFPGRYITIVDKEVRYVVQDDDAEFQMWCTLKPDEQLEAYTRYIPRRDEIFVV
jgi:hypothetical protein